MLFYRYSVMLTVFALAVSRSRDCLCMIGLQNASLILFYFAVARYHGLINTHSVKDSMGSTTVSSPSSPSNSKNEAHIR